MLSGPTSTVTVEALMTDSAQFASILLKLVPVDDYLYFGKAAV